MGSKREARQNEHEVGQVIELDVGLRAAHRHGVDQSLLAEDARYAAKCIDELVHGKQFARWVLLQVKPEKCDELAEQIRGFGIGVWQPQATRRVRIQHTRKFKTITEDIVPGYFFVRVGDVAAAAFGLSSLRHVYGVLTNGGKPIAVSDEMIEMWKTEIHDASQDKKNVVEIMEGSKVSVIGGSLQGFQAVVTALIESREAVFADVNIFGSVINSEIPLEIVKFSD
ncbi:transcription termination/antitermination protein NusG [Lentilitoribacter sp. EG35]|uniref:transcription termination/antitermination protein NusG n=1 Tax=Lentilitoribacter sp. EG35 TaxID=3234192 RepID=UPI0034615311